MSDIGCQATGYVYMYTGIFENAAFSMRLGLVWPKLLLFRK